MSNRNYALAELLHVDRAEVSKLDDERFEVNGEEWLVLDDSEADERCAEYIKESLWAFNASFIGSHCKPRLSDKAEAALQKAQQELCEDANDLVEAMIHDLDHFIKDAISADGRGHFLNPYDGEEYEVHNNGTWYLYRLN